ncbi:MAG: DUF3999 family protein [Acidobacteria bacterium]|nr:DUF3999 family protein [Acidobacteriota bacterium]
MNRKLLILLMLLGAVGGFAQIDNFALRREINGARIGWARIVLPDQIYAKISGLMTDVRIVGIRPNGERFEVPYVLRQVAESKEKTVEFKVVNQVAGKGGRFVTFEVPTAEPLNLIDLTFSKENFDWRVRLEGSSDQKEWMKILDDYRIVGFKNTFTSYSFTTLRFPDAKFKYFRLFIPTNEDPGFVRASLIERVSDKTVVRSYPVKSFKVSEDKPFRLSVIDLELADRVPLNSLRVRVKDKIDFYRPISIEYVAGTNANNEPVYKRGAADVFSSFDNEGFRFPVFAADKLRITVSNQDSPPLSFEAFEISGTPYELVAQFPEDARYFLVYSKPETPKPEYDIAKFADKIPATVTELKLGDEETSGDSAPASKPWMSSPLWLWPVMIAAIVLMGFFAFRMLRR